MLFRTFIIYLIKNMKLSTKEPLKYFYPKKGLKIKLPFDDKLEVIGIGYQFALSERCKRIIKEAL